MEHEGYAILRDARLGPASAAPSTGRANSLADAFEPALHELKLDKTPEQIGRPRLLRIVIDPAV